jgi:hypothetical protein
MYAQNNQSGGLKSVKEEGDDDDGVEILGDSNADMNVDKNSDYAGKYIGKLQLMKSGKVFLVADDGQRYEVRWHRGCAYMGMHGKVYD